MTPKKVKQAPKDRAEEKFGSSDSHLRDSDGNKTPQLELIGIYRNLKCFLGSSDGLAAEVLLS